MKIVKRCPKCCETKAVSAFNRNRGSHDGLQPYCRDCAAESNRQRAADVRTRRLAGELPTTPVGQKRCSRCGETKPAAEMATNSAAPTGLSAYCKECHREKRRERIYGLTADEYAQMADDQGNLCATCKAQAPLVIDHDHETGAVRGLLCALCNSMIGYAKDSAATLQAAADYIIRGETK